MKVLVNNHPLHLEGAPVEDYGLLLSIPNKINLSAIEKSDFDLAIDNGCYNGFKIKPFLRLLLKLKKRPFFVVAPYNMGDNDETLRLWDYWEPIINDLGFAAAFVLQDGITWAQVPKTNYLFVGGSTDFKMGKTAIGICQKAKAKGSYIHVGRVNSKKRMRRAFRELKADSIDGQHWSKFIRPSLETSDFSRWLESIKNQPPLFQ